LCGLLTAVAVFSVRTLRTGIFSKRPFWKSSRTPPRKRSRGRCCWPRSDLKSYKSDDNVITTIRHNTRTRTHTCLYIIIIIIDIIIDINIYIFIVYALSDGPIQWLEYFAPRRWTIRNHRWRWPRVCRTTRFVQSGKCIYPNRLDIEV